jgi:hypothetical protein
MYTKITVADNNRVTVADNNRVIVTRNDRFARLLTPGVHRIFAPPMLRIGVESHELRFPLLKSKWTRFLMHQRPDLVSQHFVVLETGSLDIAMVSVNGVLYDVILPDKTVLCWKDSGKITVELANIGSDYDAPIDAFSELKLPPIPADLDENEDDWVFKTQAES